MTEENFIKAFDLVKGFTSVQLLQAKNSLFVFMQEMELEKKNISNEVRRSVYYFQVSNRVKVKRIKYIDEIIVPRQSEFLDSDLNKVFPDAKTTSLNRLKRFRKERERLLKVTGDHSLRVKQSARLLMIAYTESEKLGKQYQSIIEAEQVRLFFRQQDVNPSIVKEDEMPRYYQMFRKGGI